MDYRNLGVKLFFQLADVRLELYYVFGLACLGSWLAFNLWILRDYFFPWWFSPIYTETGLSEQKLQFRKREILVRHRVSIAFQVPTLIGAPPGKVVEVIALPSTISQLGQRTMSSTQQQLSGSLNAVSSLSDQRNGEGQRFQSDHFQRSMVKWKMTAAAKRHSASDATAAERKTETRKRDSCVAFTLPDEVNTMERDRISDIHNARLGRNASGRIFSV